ncbi:hypothetical protein [Butyrivibrio sp. VCD2006]|uniref:hypothetical protein n=1 Tax=Butyrivibrio sp. VCD2006 TaxID=1280664 RepID=UPI000427FE8E|nr:hypothetical protein [Butyrivibrio sp. VCD2006]
MLDKLLDKAERGTPEERFDAGKKVFFLIFGMEALALAASSLLSVATAYLLGSEIAGMVSIFLYIPAFTLLFLYLIDERGPFGEKLERLSEKIGALKESAKKTSKRYNVMPHFGKMFKLSQIIDILRNEEFVPHSSCKKHKAVKVSKSDKWVCILGGYLPIDLICGYNKDENEIYAIDGTIIKLPLMAKLPDISNSIEAFFEERGEYFKTMPVNADAEFKTALRRPADELSRADWGRVRYLWEKYIASNKTKDSSDTSKQKYAPVSKSGAPNADFFERVLSDAEIAKTASAVRNGKIALSHYMDFDDYKNEFSVCNGIKLLEDLKQPNNFLQSADFLFDCLRDVDEAYFHMAVDFLKKCPKESVEEEIEKHVKIAYEDYDVMKMGGLLYLAKQINYEIDYVKKIKEAQSAPLKEGTGDTEVTVPGFDFDEVAAFGDEEVQRFSLGAYMYQKK